MDGIERLRASARGLTLRELADDIADYTEMRPETASVLEAFATFIAGLHSDAAPAAHGRAHSVRTLLPGEAADVASGADPERWVTVYTQLLDAAEATDLGLDVHVHLLSRLTYWQTRTSDANLEGRRVTPVAAP